MKHSFHLAHCATDESAKNGFTDGPLDLHEEEGIKKPLGPRKIELEQQIIGLEQGNVRVLEPVENWNAGKSA